MTLLSFERRAHRTPSHPDRIAPTEVSCDPGQASALDLAAAKAWSALGSMQTNEAIQAIDELEAMNLAPCAGRPDASRADMDVLLAIGAVLRDELEAAVAILHASASLKLRPRHVLALRALQRYCYWHLRDFGRFYAVATRRPWLVTTKSEVVCAVVSLSIEAAAEAEQLRIPLAERLAKDAIALAGNAIGNESPVATLATTVLAQLEYEMGDLDGADRLVRNRLTAIGHAGSVEANLLAYITSARVAAARHSADFGLRLLHRAESIGQLRHWPRLVVASIGERLALYVREGRIDEAQACIDRLDKSLVDHGSTRTAHYGVIAHARMAMACGRPLEALAPLDRLRDEALEGHHLAMAVRLTILYAAALYQAGREDIASTELLAALYEGAEAGLYRTFLDEGHLIQPLLKRLYQSSDERRVGRLRPYMGSLLGSASAPDMVRRRVKSMEHADEALSTRECNILRLISVGMSNKYIAKELRIAPETVKSHAKHIFIKLGAKTRAEAVSRAAGLGLI